MHNALKYFTFLLLATPACEKDKAVKKDRQPAAVARIAGMGGSVAHPQGKAFQLPRTVELTQPVHGGDCQATASNSYGMTYARVSLCLSLRNRSGIPVRVTLPQGLIFTAADAHIKNGLLPRDIEFTLAPREERHIRIGALCINPARNMPSYTDLYTLGPVCKQSVLTQFYTLFNRKRIYEHDAPQRDFDAAIIAQSLLWKLVDSAGLAREDVALAKSLTDIN